MQEKQQTLAETIHNISVFVKTNIGDLKDPCAALFPLLRTLEGAHKDIQKFQENLNTNPAYAFNWMERARCAAQELDMLCRFFRIMQNVARGEAFVVAVRRALEHSMEDLTRELLEHSVPLGTDSAELRLKAAASVLRALKFVSQSINKDLGV